MVIVVAVVVVVVVDVVIVVDVADVVVVVVLIVVIAVHSTRQPPNPNTLCFLSPTCQPNAIQALMTCHHAAIGDHVMRARPRHWHSALVKFSMPSAE